MQVRLVEEEDRPQVAQFMATIYGYHGDVEAMETMLRCTKAPVQFPFLALDDDGIQGIAVWRLDEVEVSTFILDLAWIAVAPQYQGNGLGKRLIFETVKRVVTHPFLSERELEYVTLEVDPENESALAFYRKIFGEDVETAKVGKYLYLIVGPERVL